MAPERGRFYAALFVHEMSLGTLPYVFDLFFLTLQPGCSSSHMLPSGVKKGGPGHSLFHLTLVSKAFHQGQDRFVCAKPLDYELCMLCFWEKEGSDSGRIYLDSHEPCPSQNNRSISNLTPEVVRYSMFPALEPELASNTSSTYQNNSSLPKPRFFLYSQWDGEPRQGDYGQSSTLPRASTSYRILNLVGSKTERLPTQYLKGSDSGDISESSGPNGHWFCLRAITLSITPYS